MGWFFTAVLHNFLTRSEVQAWRRKGSTQGLGWGQGLSAAFVVRGMDVPELFFHRAVILVRV